MKMLTLVMVILTGVPATYAQISPVILRKVTVEIRQADQSGQYTINFEGTVPVLQFESLTKSLRTKLSKADADDLTRLFKDLPVVPKLPADCDRDYARVVFQPDDQRPRATCLSQDTAYSKKYRLIVRALDLAFAKSGEGSVAKPPKTPAADSSLEPRSGRD